MFLNKRAVNTVIMSLFMLFKPVFAGSQFYGAALDEAKWRVSGNRLECRLSQLIPGYGKATFRRHSLQSMQFRVLSNYTPRKDTQALVYISPPHWKRYANRMLLGRTPLSAQKNIITLPEDWAFRMAMELREGMEAVWSHSDWADEKDIVFAKVLPLDFEHAWRDFQRCNRSLIDYGYADVKLSSLYFNKKSMRLNQKDRFKLNRLAEYVLLDTEYQYIKINSHTDSRGIRGKNLAISKKRAKMIKKYLINKGLSPKRFVIVARGEKKPKYNNRTQSGRAKNRRVEIRLVK